MIEILNATLKMKSLFDTMLYELSKEVSSNNYKSIYECSSYRDVKVMSNALNVLIDYYNCYTEDTRLHISLTSPWDVYDLRDNEVPF